MDHANNPHGMGMAAQTLAPHHQNPIFLPPTQPHITHHHPQAIETIMSPTTVIQHHQPYDPHYFHHQQQQQQQQQHHNFVMQNEKNHIHTLFVSGLPDDIKAREIHNLFRRRHGFDSCQLKYTGRGNQVVAFATFFNHQSAMAALNVLNGITFDPQTGATLHIELARSNSRRNRPPENGAYVIIDKRSKVAYESQEARSNDGDSESDEPSGTDNPSYSKEGELATAESGGTAVDPDNAGAAINEQSEIFIKKEQSETTVAVKKEQSEMTVAGEIPPCSTLFIANLGPNCTEEELKQVLSQYPGFNVLKMRARGGMPVAFADFEDIEFSTEVMQSLQGSMLPSSDRGGMHLEYARSKMRKP